MVWIGQRYRPYGKLRQQQRRVSLQQPISKHNPNIPAAFQRPRLPRNKEETTTPPCWSLPILWKTCEPSPNQLAYKPEPFPIPGSNSQADIPNNKKQIPPIPALTNQPNQHIEPLTSPKTLTTLKISIIESPRKEFINVHCVYKQCQTWSNGCKHVCL